MDRIAFIKLGLSLVATEACLAGCASDDDASTGSGGAGATGGDRTDASGGNAGTSMNGGSAAGLPSTPGTAGNGGSAGSAGAGMPPELCTTDANLVQTSMESHDHLPLTTPITAGDLNAGMPTEFAVALEQNHIHTLSFTADDFRALRAGMAISKRSSSMMGHTHTYLIKCV